MLACICAIVCVYVDLCCVRMWICAVCAIPWASVFTCIVCVWVTDFAKCTNSTMRITQAKYAVRKENTHVYRPLNRAVWVYLPSRALTIPCVSRIPTVASHVSSLHPWVVVRVEEHRQGGDRGRRVGVARPRTVAGPAGGGAHPVVQPDGGGGGPAWNHSASMAIMRCLYR